MMGWLGIGGGPGLRYGNMNLRKCGDGDDLVKE